MNFALAVNRSLAQPKQDELHGQLAAEESQNGKQDDEGLKRREQAGVKERKHHGPVLNA